MTKDFKDLMEQVRSFPETRIEETRKKVREQVKHALVNGQRWCKVFVPADMHEIITKDLTDACFKVKPASENDGDLIIDW